MGITKLDDTIAAIATPLGTGGVGVIRVSGENAISVVTKIFKQKLSSTKPVNFKPDTINYGWIVNNGEPVDQVLVLIFKNPKSFTGEDVAEIHCHGGMNIIKNVLNLCLQNGARSAERGEFTKRAFLNGKMDLSRAEAVLDIINSKTDRFSSACAHNLLGKLNTEISKIRTDLIELLSKITAAIDFPEEVEEPDYCLIEEEINIIIGKINDILKTAKTSNLMRQGIKIALVGKPNVGKSSLFNAILDMERAIVTNIAGTTRDILQETIDIAGIPVNLIDTAGLREIQTTSDHDHIESIGINVSKSYINDADLVLFVTDLTQGELEEDKIIYSEISNKPIIKIGSKADLVENFNDEIIPVSSKTKQGIPELKQKIEDYLLQNNLTENTEFATNIRQQECLNQAKEALFQALETCKLEITQDLIAIDLKASIEFLGEITGEIITEEILNNIFENFCIGK